MPGSHGSDERWSGGTARRSGYYDIFDAVKDKEDQERAMQLAESLMRHELTKRVKKFVLWKRANFSKFLLMLISFCSFLVLLHADFHTEFYPAFAVQLGTSTPLFPSVFRVSTTYLRLNLASPVIDVFIVLIILVHHSMAAITLLMTILKTMHPNCKEQLYFVVALLFFGAGICLMEIGSLMFSAQLQRRSSSWASSVREAEPDQRDQPVTVLL